MTENDEIWNESGDDYGQESVNEWQSMKIIIQLWSLFLNIIFSYQLYKGVIVT